MKRYESIKEMYKSESGNQINWEDLSENRRKYWRDKFNSSVAASPYKKGITVDFETLKPVDPEVDLINTPPHYTTSEAKCPGCGKTIEQIFISRHMPFNLGNVVKYLWRLGKKSDDIEQLKKAAFYLADEIARRERERDA